jgi:putative ATPase
MEKQIPLAHRIRPTSLNEFQGQAHLIGEGKPLRIIIDSKELPSSIILWGPPGCGKTTIARILAKSVNADFVELSAVSASKDDIKATINRTRLMNKKGILFLDEIHRFNKAQQDFLLPFVEKGTITLIGATTENPSFEVISPLLSRSTVFVLNQLSENEIQLIIKSTITKLNINCDEENINLISRLANGDARSALNILELASYLSPNNITKESILEAVQKPNLRYDKNGEEHYNIISALHKSMRDSDPDASVYWTMRMIEAGEDPKYIIRRMIRFASEDIGNADTNALVLATAVKDTVEFLGYPECNTALVQLAIYLAKSPKNNSAYQSVNLAKAEIENSGNLPVPLHLRNAPTKLMKDLDYGKGYKYAHDYENAKIDQQHLPDRIKDKKFYYEKK